MSRKNELLSESLDQMNIGIIPETEDQEVSDLLEIAALLRKSGLKAPPPEHILSATVQRSVEGLSARKHSSRKSWMYSGFLGAAAALLIFFGLHGLRSPQEISAVVTPPPQAASGPPAEKMRSDAIVHPSEETSAPEKQKSASKPDSPSPSDSTSSPQPSKPQASAAPSATPPQPPAADVPSRQETPVAPSLKSMPSPRSVEQAALPAAQNVLNLPGRTPELVTHDSTVGTVRQVYDQGTAKELIITRRITPTVEKKAVRKASPRIAAEADSAKSLAFQDSNKVIVFIKGQEVTLEGRQTLQELTELGEKLKAANP